MKTIQLSEDWRQSRAKPLAWLVGCPDGYEYDFQVFFGYFEAETAAEEFDYDEPERHIYPLYAGAPLIGKLEDMRHGSIKGRAAGGGDAGGDVARRRHKRPRKTRASRPRKQ